MKIKVFDTDTGNELFDYKSYVLPRLNETIMQNDDGIELVVDSLRHRIYGDGDPVVELYCKIL
jgi:Tfp pilus tip-associated adhesin PilY1